MTIYLKQFNIAIRVNDTLYNVLCVGTKSIVSNGDIVAHCIGYLILILIIPQFQIDNIWPVN